MKIPRLGDRERDRFIVGTITSLRVRLFFSALSLSGATLRSRDSYKNVVVIIATMADSSARNSQAHSRFYILRNIREI